MKNKNILLLFFGVLFIIVSICIRVFNTPEEMADFSKINEKDVKSYLYLDLIDMTNNDYYLVYMDDELYALKSNIDLKQYDYDGVTVKVTGVSKEFNQTDKNAIIILYNNNYSESEDSQINEEDFDIMFGHYYLEVDEVVDDIKVESKTYQLNRLFLEIGIALLAVFALMMFIDYKKQI